MCQSKTRSRRYNFYSRPCGRGDYRHGNADERRNHFYSRPCGRGDKNQHLIGRGAGHFYSRPCGRGDTRLPKSPQDISSFLLTPLREGRPDWHRTANHCNCISTHAPAGGATLEGRVGDVRREGISTHAPAGGATLHPIHSIPPGGDFYSRPCGRGDGIIAECEEQGIQFLLTPLREGRQI